MQPLIYKCLMQFQSMSQKIFEKLPSFSIVYEITGFYMTACFTAFYIHVVYLKYPGLYWTVSFIVFHIHIVYLKYMGFYMTVSFIVFYIHSLYEIQRILYDRFYMVMSGCCLHSMGLLPNLEVVMISKMFFEYNHPSKHIRFTCIDGLINPLHV